MGEVVGIGSKKVLAVYEEASLYAMPYELPEWIKVETIGLGDPPWDLRSRDAEIIEYAPDLMIFMGIHQLVPEYILDIAPCVGFHPTPLPKMRGPAPLSNLILRGSKETCVTMFYLDDRVDHGDIIAQDWFPIRDVDTTVDLLKKCRHAMRRLITKYLPSILMENAPRIPQDDNEATYTQPITSNELPKIATVEYWDKKIRASKAYGGAYFVDDYGNKLYVLEYRVEKGQ